MPLPDLPHFPGLFAYRRLRSVFAMPKLSVTYLDKVFAIKDAFENDH